MLSYGKRAVSLSNASKIFPDRRLCTLQLLRLRLGATRYLGRLNYSPT